MPVKLVPCCSTRNRSAPLCLGYDGQQGYSYDAELHGTSLKWLYNKVAECPSLPPSSYKASASDPNTLSFNKAMNNRNNINKWMKAANDKIKSLQKNGHGKKCLSPTPRLAFFRVPGHFGVNVLPMVLSSASTRHGTVYGEISKKPSRRPLPQSWLGALYGCFSNCRSHYVGKLAPSTSAAALLFKLFV